MAAIRSRLTYPHVVSTLALFVALGGSAWAIGANSVGSKQIKKNGVKNADIAANAVTSPKVADGSLLSTDFAAGQLPAGPDSGPGILSKLTQVDGSGSGLDADLLDGVDSGGFVQAGAGAGGDVSGPFSALDIGADTIGARELASTAFYTNDHVGADDPVGGGVTETPFASGVPSDLFQLIGRCDQAVAGQPLATVLLKNTGSGNASADSTAEGGNSNLTGVGPGTAVKLVETGGVPGATFQTGSYSAVVLNFIGTPRPISGIAYAGTNVSVNNCFFGVTAIG